MQPWHSSQTNPKSCHKSLLRRRQKQDSENSKK
jgi:hypothetical protein